MSAAGEEAQFDCGHPRNFWNTTVLFGGGAEVCTQCRKSAAVKRYWDRRAAQVALAHKSRCPELTGGLPCLNQATASGLCIAHERKRERSLRCKARNCKSPPEVLGYCEEHAAKRGLL